MTGKTRTDIKLRPSRLEYYIINVSKQLILGSSQVGTVLLYVANYNELEQLHM